MSKKLLIAFSTVAGIALVAENFEFERVIEGQVSVTSDQFVYTPPALPAIIEESDMRQSMYNPRIRYAFKNDDSVGYDSIDRERSYNTHIIPIQTQEGFYRVKLEIPFGDNAPEVKEGDSAIAIVSGNIREHITNYLAAQETHPFRTPVVTVQRHDFSI